MSRTKRGSNEDTTPIAAVWERLERALAALVPELDLKLRPPASAESIEAAERALDVRFPADFRASLLVHDGQDDEPDLRILPVAERLGSLEGLVKCWTEDRPFFDGAESEGDRFDGEGRLRPVHLHPRHIPIAGSSHWDYGRLLLDYAPGPNGTLCQVIARDGIELRHVSVSFADLLVRTTLGLESGTIVVSEPGEGQRTLEYLSPRGRKRITGYAFFRGTSSARLPTRPVSP